METTDCDSSQSTGLDSSWTHNQVVEFGVTCVKIIANTKRDLEIPKPGPRTSQNSKNNDQQFDNNVKDSVIPCHHSGHTTTPKQISLVEALNSKIKIHKIVLGVLLCTLTIAIAVPAGLVVRTLLHESDASVFEFPIYQNYCKINEPSMVG